MSEVLENVFFTNIVNVTHFDLQNQLLIPIVVFTDADPYSVRVAQLQQEIEETKMKVRQIFKTHLRMRRAHLVTEIVYLRNNISLLNSIQASFIDSITLLNSNNSVTTKRYRRIVRLCGLFFFNRTAISFRSFSNSLCEVAIGSTNVTHSKKTPVFLESNLFGLSSVDVPVFHSRRELPRSRLRGSQTLLLYAVEFDRSALRRAVDSRFCDGSELQKHAFLRKQHGELPH